MKISLQRQSPLPRCLAIVNHNFSKGIEAKVFTLLDTQTKQCVGRMFTNIKRNYLNDEIYPLVNRCDSLYIEKLEINKNCRRKGYGTEFIKIAQCESRNQNCQGRIHLIASSTYDLNHPAHIFYRKKGFNTVYHEINCELDNCISTGKKRYFEPMFMYLPIGDKAPVSILTKFKEFINKIIRRK